MGSSREAHVASFDGINGGRVRYLLFSMGVKQYGLVYDQSPHPLNETFSIGP